MDRCPSGSSVHGILQARTLEWVAISSSRGSSRPGNRTHVSCDFRFADGFSTHWAITESQYSGYAGLNKMHGQVFFFKKAPYHSYECWHHFINLKAFPASPQSPLCLSFFFFFSAQEAHCNFRWSTLISKRCRLRGTQVHTLGLISRSFTSKFHHWD